MKRSTWWGTVAVALALTLVAAACGDDDDDDGAGAATTPTAGAATTAGSTPDDSAATTVPAEEAFDPEGEIRVAANLIPNVSGAWDPIMSFSNFDYQRLVYDTLVRLNPDGTLAPGLARSWEVVDGSTLKLELQPDVVFSDGTPFDGEAVKVGLMRNATEQARGFRPEVKALQEVIVDDPTHVTLKFSAPVAGNWVGLLVSGETMIPSPKAIADGVDLNTNPVGAGPYLLESFTMESSARLVKNPDYFEADKIKLAAIELVHIAADPAAVSTALRSGNIDVVPQLSPSVAADLRGADGVNIESGSSGNVWHQIFLCKSRPPFDDVRVRQALNYAVDRDALAQSLYGKPAEPVEGSWPRGHIFHNPELEGMYDHDPDRARQLLAEAGYDDSNPLEFTAFFTAGDGQRVMEIVQAQFAEVGVNMELQQTQDIFGDFLTSARQPAAHIGMQRQGTGKITRIYGAGVPTNVCQYNNPVLETTMATLAAVDQGTPSEEAIELWREAQEIVHREALSVFLVFADEASGWRDRVGGVELTPNYSTGSLFPDLFDLYVRA